MSKSNCHLSSTAPFIRPFIPQVVIAAIIICFSSSTRDLSADSTQIRKPVFANVSTALNVAKNSQDKNEQLSIIANIDNDPAESATDLKSLYDLMDDVRAEYKEGNKGANALTKAKAISRAISKCTQPQFNSEVATLLEDENQSLPARYMGPVATLGLGETESELFEYSRLEALTKAAGNSQNKEALPALREMAERNDAAGDLARVAIAKIGQPEDLQSAINQIKQNSQKRAVLGEFGRPGLNALLSEIRNPSVTITQKKNLAGFLRQFTSHDTLDVFVGLLHDKDPHLREIAAQMIAQTMAEGDESILDQMLHDSDGEIRGEAINSISRKFWNASNIQVVCNILLTDRNELVRESAAIALGEHRTVSAKPDLERALQDKSAWVRDAAKGAIDLINRK